MEEYGRALLLALMPFGGNAFGMTLGRRVPMSPRLIGALLHAAAGIAIAVVSIELMPRVLEDIRPWQLAAAFCAGAAFSMLMVAAVRWSTANRGGGRARVWMVYVAVAMDLLGDGLMVGVGTTVSSQLGFLLGISQIAANVPGGFAAAANFRRKEVPRAAHWLAAVGGAVPVFAGATAGYWLLRDASVSGQNAALSFVAGVLLLATVEDMVPEADEPPAPRWLTTIAFTAGFVLFALLSLYVDS